MNMTKEEFAKLRERVTQKAKEKPTWVIAIDPDVDKNGVAILNTKTRELTTKSLKLYQAIIEISSFYDECKMKGEKVKIYIEAGWLNKSNWHIKRNDSPNIAAAKGHATGRNHQVGHIFVESLNHLRIPVEERKPLKKCWRGKDGKITHNELEQIVGQKLPRCNQDARDAALIAWTEAGLPIQVKRSIIEIFGGKITPLTE